HTPLSQPGEGVSRRDCGKERWATSVTARARRRAASSNHSAGRNVVFVSGPSSDGCPGGRWLQSATVPGGRAQPRDSAWRPGGDRPPWRSRAAGRAVFCCMPPARTTLWPVMEQRPLGKSGLQVSRIGLGCMGMSEFYGPADEDESSATLELAVDRGVTFLDTADMYGAGKNEELLADILRRRRKEIVLATKFGIVRDPVAPTDATRRRISGKPDYVRSACEASLRRLKVDVIDLYYQHRVDPSTPIEETVGAMAELVKEGKVRALGLSEATVEVIRRAAKVHPIAALQSEYSLWTRDPEDGPLPACPELGIPLVAYRPLG